MSIKQCSIVFARFRHGSQALLIVFFTKNVVFILRLAVHWFEGASLSYRNRARVAMMWTAVSTVIVGKRKVSRFPFRPSSIRPAMARSCYLIPTSSRDGVYPTRIRAVPTSRGSASSRARTLRSQLSHLLTLPLRLAATVTLGIP
jgi:hypothetical protein